MMRTQIEPLALNGKFLGAAPTGVHRVAAELSNALIALGREGQVPLDIELWIAADCVEGAGQIDLPPRVLRPLRHIPWEQIVLPFRGRRRLLLNLCNLGPVLRRNCVTMIHDTQVHLTPESYSRAFRLWYKLVQPVLGRRHRAILTVSEFSRRQIIEAGICPADRVVAIPNGVDHILRVPADADVLDRLQLAPGGFVVALASTLAHKNIGLLLRAFALPGMEQVRLVLVGSGSAEVFASRGLVPPPNCLFAGRVSDGALRTLYENALCIAFPSLTEGFGLPPLEAMLLGCPAIVAPCGALPEVCGDAVLYGDAHDPDDWARLILTLANDPQKRAHYAALGRTQAGRFTWRAAATRLLALLERLSAERGVPQVGRDSAVRRALSNA